MKKFFLGLGMVSVLAGLSIGLIWISADKGISEPKSSFQKTDKSNRIGQYFEYLSLLRSNSATNKVEASDFIALYNEMKMIDAAGSRTGEIGLDWEFMGPDNFGGRTRALLIDLNNQNTYYAGGVSGGMYKSTDAGLNWSEFNALEGGGFIPNTPIGAIEQGPDGTIYIGTGEGFSQSGFGVNFNSGAYGGGMFKLSPGATAWSPVSSTIGAAGWSTVAAIAVDPTNSSHIMVALNTGGGIRATTDGGTTWAAPSGAPGSGSGQDVKFSPDGATVYATVDGKLYLSNNGGNSFINKTGSSGYPGPIGISRSQVAVPYSDNNIAYAVITDAQGCMVGVYKTSDLGSSWTQIGTPSSTFDPFTQPGDALTGCQGWYDCCIAVSPADPEKIYLGGIQFWTYSSATGWVRADQLDSEGGSISSSNYIHADKHTIEFHPDNADIMLVGHDGGITKSENAESSFPLPTYRTRNKNYSTAQFYSGAAKYDGTIIGGTQDNGTFEVTGDLNTNTAATRIMGGDGAYCDISKLIPNIYFASVYYSQMSRSNNSGNSWACIYDNSIDDDGDCCPGGAGTCEQNPFIASSILVESDNVGSTSIRTTEFMNNTASTIPAGTSVDVISSIGNVKFDYILPSDLAAGDTMIVPDKYVAYFFQCTQSGLWMCKNPLNITQTSRWYRVSGVSMGSFFTNQGMGMDYTPDGNILYVGTGAGIVYKISGLNSAVFDDATALVSGVTVSIVSSGTGAVTGIDVNDNNPDHVIWTRGGFGSTHVQQTLNAGATVSNISNDLPNMPVYGVVIDNYNEDNIVLATELGIWTSTNGGTNWAEDNNNILRTPVFRIRQMYQYESDCWVIYAFTHGRGAWRVQTPGASGCMKPLAISGSVKDAQPVLSLYPNPATDFVNVEFSLKSNTAPSVQLFDLSGRLIRNVSLGEMSAGTHKARLNLDGLPKGTYLVVLNDHISAPVSTKFTVK